MPRGSPSTLPLDNVFSWQARALASVLRAASSTRVVLPVPVRFHRHGRYAADFGQVSLTRRTPAVTSPPTPHLQALS